MPTTDVIFRPSGSFVARSKRNPTARGRRVFAVRLLGNPLEGAPNGLATRVSMLCRVRSSLWWVRDRDATVSHRGLTRTPVTLSEYAGRS